MPVIKDRPETWCQCEGFGAGTFSPTCPVHTTKTLEERAEMRRLLIHLDGGAPDAFTCDRCGGADDCEWAFDWYNTDGDCLAEK